jgi:transcriptional regulator with XRE-family HTH domain
MDTSEQYVIDYVRRYRITNKLTQEDISNIIGVSTSFIGNVENAANPAKYNLKHIRLLAESFGISMQAFFPA